MLEIALNEAKGKHVLAALSGGADSVALLHLLCRERDRGDLTLSAAHFEHGIRGDESLRDAEFCEGLCRELDVPFYLEHADVPGIAKAGGEGIESCARSLRHAFLERTRVTCGAELIALAHHRDDQTETVLMHLLRGAGPGGLRGMRRLNGVLYRPLLDVPKAELISYLTKIGQPWREDATNAVADNPRNRLRLREIPELERIYPACGAAIARHARIAAVEDDFLRRLTDEFLRERAEKLPNGWKIDLRGEIEEALLRRGLMELTGRALSADKLEEILHLKTACCAEGGLRAAKSGDTLYLARPFDAGEAALSLCGATVLPGLCRIVAEDAPPVPETKLRSTQVLDAWALKGAVLRTRRAGDRIAPFGMEGTKSLSDYMTDLKIPRPMRDLVPIVARGSEALWAVGYGISRVCALRGRRAVKLICKYEGWGGFKP